MVGLVKQPIGGANLAWSELEEVILDVNHTQQPSPDLSRR